MVTCRPDISYPVIKLSQYSSKPATVHYQAIKDIYRYLATTANEGIYYWREAPREDLPVSEIPILKKDGNYNEMDVIQRAAQYGRILTGLVDSDHASDTSHRKSVTGINIQIAGGTVLYKTKYQDVIAQSSTEAEFIAAAEAGKHILYLRTILSQIGLEQDNATILYEDNQGALLMAQAGKPTKRTKHIDIKHFAIQQWVEQDLINFQRIATSDNSADAMTKATPKTLFYRHMNHVMGKLVPHYATHLATERVNQQRNNEPTIKVIRVPLLYSSEQGGM